MSRGSSSDDRHRRGRGGGRASSRVGEWLVIIFCFGTLAFSPLAMGMFDRPRASIFGVPLLYFYLFTAWGLLIAAITLVMESQGESRGSRPAAEQGRQRPRSEAR